MRKAILLSAALALAAPLHAGQLDARLDSVSRQFAGDSAARGLSSPTLAVFPFNCDEKLAAKRVDLAVSELLTARLLRNGSFKLMERAQLETALKEQALGLSGAVDSAAAAKAGKLAGARLAVLGTVARVGKSYQIGSKLIDTETAETLSTSIIEVPLETFDAEAARYLVLVPEREALGLYLSLNGWTNRTKDLPALSVPNSGTPEKTLSFRSEDADLWGVGVGLRYQVAKKWYADLTILPAVTMGSFGKFTVEGGNSPQAANLMGEGARLSANRVSSLSRKFRLMYGLGYQAYLFGAYTGRSEAPLQVGSTYLYAPGGDYVVHGPFGRLGLEFKPRQRFAIGVFGHYTLMDPIEIRWTERSSRQKLKVAELEVPPFSMETTFTFYF